MKLFQCQVCLEKDKRIAEMQDQISYLRELANPGKLTVQIPAVHAEMDAVLSGRDAPIEVQQISEEAEALDSEAMRILTGNF